MKTIAILPAMALLLAPIAAIADPGPINPPHVLYSGSLLCKSPEIYQEAADSETGSSRAEMLDANQCMSITEDDIEEMLAPFVEVIEKRGNMVLVQYAVEYEEKLELLHRKVAQALAPVVMVLLGLPFAFRVGRRGSLYGIGVALLLVLVYWATFAVFNALGLETLLPPAIAAWAPNAIYALVGTYLLLYVPT